MKHAWIARDTKCVVKKLIEILSGSIVSQIYDIYFQRGSCQCTFPGRDECLGKHSRVFHRFFDRHSVADRQNLHVWQINGKDIDREIVSLPFFSVLSVSPMR